MPGFLRRVECRFGSFDLITWRHASYGEKQFRIGVCGDQDCSLDAHGPRFPVTDSCLDRKASQLENAFNLGDVEEMSPVPNLIRFVDLFCGIGGFHLAAQVAAGDLGIKALCVFASDIDPDCRDSYEANFGIKPAGDITEIPEKSIPDHDFLFAGFPCQSFSICGDRDS